MSFRYFYNALLKILLLYVVGLFIFMLFRTALLLVFGDFNELATYGNDLLHAYWVGFRFDTSVLTYGLLPAIILSLIIIFVPSKSENSYRLFKRIILPYSSFMFAVFLLILFIDFFFFKFAQAHLNTLAFGIIMDDTFAVLESVWSDYPILKVLVFIALVVFLLHLLTQKIIRAEFEPFIAHKFPGIISIFFLIPLYALAMRGSIGTFPLETDNTTISTNTFVNALTINGVFSLKEAIVEFQKQEINTDIPDMLDTYHFKSADEAIAVYLDTTIDNKENLQQYLLSKTVKNTFLEKHPPNVVFIQMESMSNYYLDIHSKEMNLLGKLESQLPYCYLFRNFLSCTNGTIHTLEGLMVNSPMTPLSQSSYMNVSLSSSVAYPFKQKGYKTNFITGAKLGWRNLDKFVPKQYFDNCEGSATLLDKVKNAQSCEWGTFDEYLFDRMFDVLNEHTDKPQFIFAMTTTNHTPFELPTTYRPLPINIPASLTKRFRTEPDIALKNFTNYQYANDCLGRFIEKVRNSPLGKNTIIVASGDHNTMQVFDFSDSQLLQKYSVPLVMYVPETYKPSHIIDTSRFGSHKDIFPTIFNRALSDVSYMNSGNDLFSTNTNTYFFSENNYTVAINQYGCVLMQEQPLFFKWKKGAYKTLEACNSGDVPELNKLLLKLRAHIASMDFYIQTELRK